VRYRTLLVSALASASGTAVCASACSSFEATPSAPDGSASDGGTTEDGPTGQLPDGSALDGSLPVGDAGPCDVTHSWSMPALVPEISTSSDEFGASVFGSDVYFSRADAGYGLYRGRYAGGSFVTTQLTYFIYDVRSPAFDDSGLTLYFEGAATGVAKIYRATRANLEATMMNGASPIHASPASVKESSPSFGAGAVWYGSELTDGDSDLFRAGVQADGGVELPGPLVGINIVGANEKFPVVTGDGRRLYFASDRDKGAKNTGYDVFTATRPSMGGAFTDVTPVAELNTAFDEYPTWVSADGCKMLLMRRTGPGAAQHDIYQSTKAK
jgi:hypothetical protein